MPLPTITIVVPHGALLMVILAMLLPPISPYLTGLHKGQNASKNYVTKNLELFQDIPNLAEDFNSLICPICTLVKIFNDYYYFKIVSMRSRAHNKDIAFDKGHFEVFPKEKEDFSLCHAFL